MFVALLLVGILEPCVFVFNESGLDSYIYYWFTITLFIVDIVLRCFRAHRKSTREGVVWVTHVPEITKAYMRDWMFCVDVVSAFPLQAICDGFRLTSSQTGHALSGLRMIRFLKFARLPELLHRMNEITGWSFHVLSVFQFGCVSCLVLHWIACLWCYLGGMGHHSWLDSVQDKYAFLAFDNDRDVYLMSLYWAITVLSSVGFGDITPQARVEFFWAIVSMAIGGTVWAYVVGSVCGMAATSDKHRIAFENQVNDVNEMMKEQEVPAELSERIQEFYQHAKPFMRMQLYHETIRQLSPQLKGEIVQWMYDKCFERVWYFDVLSAREDRDACRGRRALAEGMVPKMYATEELIEDTIDGLRCLVFLRSGLCVRKCNLLAPGAVWGLDVILGSEEHDDIEHLLDVELARSITYAFVLKLSKVHIDHAASLIPSFARRLRKAHLRMLFWRGVIAASRATTRLEKKDTNLLQINATPTWDKIGKRMAQVVHMDRLLLDKAECQSQTLETDKMLRRHSSAHIHVSARRSSIAKDLRMGRTCSIRDRRRSHDELDEKTKASNERSDKRRSSFFMERQTSDSAVSEPKRQTSKEVQVRHQMVQADRIGSGDILEEKAQKTTRDQSVQVDMMPDPPHVPSAGESMDDRQYSLHESATAGQPEEVMRPLLLGQASSRRGNAGQSTAPLHVPPSDDSSRSASPQCSVRDFDSIARKPVASFKVRTSSFSESLRSESLSGKPEPAANTRTWRAAPSIEERLRRVYDAMPSGFNLNAPTHTTVGNRGGNLVSPTLSRDASQAVHQSATGSNATGLSPPSVTSSRTRTFSGQQVDRSTSQQGVAADTKAIDVSEYQVAEMEKGRTARDVEDVPESLQVSPRLRSPAASDTDVVQRKAGRQRTSKRRQRNSEDDPFLDDNVEVQPRRSARVSQRDRSASDPADLPVERVRSDSALDATSDNCEPAWRKEFEQKLDDLGEDLAVINEGIEDDFSSLRDEVSELTRLMHQLLCRFDAEEKY